jgi:hypothetical protein
MFISVLFVIARKKNQSKFSLSDEQMSKMWSILMTERFPDMKKMIDTFCNIDEPQKH